MKQIAKTRLYNLLSVKSIVTIIVTCLFAVLALKGVMEPRAVMDVYLVIISFYFGTQKGKADAENGD